MKNLTRRTRPSKESDFIFTDPRRGATANAFGTFVREICHLLADANETLRREVNSAHLTSDLQHIINSIVSLDARFKAWIERPPGSYRFTQLERFDGSSSIAPHGSKPGIPVHLYSSPSMASLWNMYRCMRILLLRSLLACMSRQQESIPLDSPFPDINSRNIPGAQDIPDLVNGILASVPYMLGDVDQNGNLIYPQQRKAVGALFLLWPLRLLLHLDVIDSKQRDWITERLEYIRNALGIHDATDPVVKTLSW